MMATVKPIPEGYHSLTPYLVVEDAPAAIEFYKKAFGAEELFRMPGPDGKVAHAEIKIGDSMLMLSEANPQYGSRSPKALGGSPASILVYVENVDAAFDRAVKAGAKVEMPVQNMFWGHRFGKLTDPFGHSWQMATHKEDVAPEEMGRRMKAAFGG
jgi:PhnB protein